MMEFCGCACIAGAPNEATGGSAQASSIIMLAACSLPALRHSGDPECVSMLCFGCSPAAAGEVDAAWEEAGVASSRGRLQDLTTEVEEAMSGLEPGTEAIPGIMVSGTFCLGVLSSCSSCPVPIVDNIMSRDG